MSIKVTRVSKPLLISSVILLIIGSSLGSLSMLSIARIIKLEFNLIPFHRTIQLEWFFTLFIMSIGYMLIPRFRNSRDPHHYIVYSSFVTIVSAITLYLLSIELAYKVLMLISVTIFSTFVFYTCKIKPRLLREADYYIILGVIALLIVSIVRFFVPYSFQYIQLSFLFPIFTILGVEYKTLPSFIGYIRPRSNYNKVSLILGIAVLIIGIYSLLRDEVSMVFNILLLTMVITFDKGSYVTHGFDYNSIKRRLVGEELVRYRYTLIYIRLAYISLYTALLLSITYNIYPSFPIYDLSIHLLTIGFIGFTIMLYLPMMLPPIIGKNIKFVRLNLIPLYLILTGLILRIVGVFNMDNKLFSLFGYSGLTTIAGFIYYLIVLHRAMVDIN